MREDRSYDSRGLLATITRYSDLAGTTKVGDTLTSYDAMGRETHILHRDGSGASLAESTYTYDLAGKLEQEDFNGAATTYGYDAANQVTAAGAETFAYDASGNRAPKEVGDPVELRSIHRGGPRRERVQRECYGPVPGDTRAADAAQAAKIRAQREIEGREGPEKADSRPSPQDRGATVGMEGPRWARQVAGAWCEKGRASEGPVTRRK